MAGARIARRQDVHEAMPDARRQPETRRASI
jgi:hypothetical protein